ncbi:Uncharacterised protein [uncultured archaeon]|nr:Uncharacterised protein [uncultured archaeon]
MSPPKIYKTPEQIEEEERLKQELEIEKAKFSQLAKGGTARSDKKQADKVKREFSDSAPLRDAYVQDDVEAMQGKRALSVVSRDPAFPTGHNKKYERHATIPGGVKERQVPMRGTSEGVLTNDDLTQYSILLSGNDFVVVSGAVAVAIVPIKAPTMGKLVRVQMATNVALNTLAGMKGCISLSQRSVIASAAGYAAYIAGGFSQFIFLTQQAFTPNIVMDVSTAQVLYDRIHEKPIPYENMDDAPPRAAGWTAAQVAKNQAIYLIIVVNKAQASLPVTKFLEFTIWTQEVVSNGVG